MAGLIQIGQSALSAAYMQLQTGGHNIANVNTPGYTRQQVHLAAHAGQFHGAGYIGNGVRVTEISRSYDAFMANEVTRSTSIAGTDKARAQQMAQLDTLLSNTEDGIGVAMDEFRSAMADLVNNPADGSARTVVAQRASAVASRFASTASRLDEMANESSKHLGEAANYVNERLSEIAELNRLIGSARGNGHQPNDLLDQRDALINEVAAKIQIHRDDQDDGSVDLYTANGHSLVQSDRAARLILQPWNDDETRPSLLVETHGTQIALNESTIGAGEIAGLIQYRDGELRRVQASVGQLAAAFAEYHNLQQELGLDAQGNPGKAMFKIGDPVVRSATENTGDLKLSVSIQDPSELKAADYRLSFVDGVYRLENTVNNSVREFTQLPIEADGLSFEAVSGSMKAGDSMTIRAGSAYASRMSSVLSNGDSVAAADVLAPVVGSANKGGLSVGSFQAYMPDANAGEAVTITFTAPDKYTISGNGIGTLTDQPYVAGTAIEHNGWSLVMRGTPAAGDKLELVPRTAVRQSNGNARALVGLGDMPLVDGQTFTQAFSSILADVGGATLHARTAEKASSRMLESAQTLVSERSGVNLDEEAARLLQYRQAYQAAAKVIQTADEMFNTILSLAR